MRINTSSARARARPSARGGSLALRVNSEKIHHNLFRNLRRDCVYMKTITSGNLGIDDEPLRRNVRADYNACVIAPLTAIAITHIRYDA